MSSPPRVNMQQASMEPSSQTNVVSDSTFTNIQDLDKMSQLTNAVSNLRPLMESFTQEQTVREKQLLQLTDENTKLKAKVKQIESLEHLSSGSTSGLCDEIISLKNSLQNKESLLQAENTNNQVLRGQVDILQKQLAELTSNQQLAMSHYAKLNADLDEKKDLLAKNELHLNNLYGENIDLKSRVDTLEQERDIYKKDFSEFYEESIKKFEEEGNRLLEENKCLILQRDECKKMTAKLENEVKETKKRLSQVMGTKLSADNPDIADLSDENRPTKLAEKYSELYDNEWTDAFEVVQQKSDETNTIKTLLNLLQDIQRFCNNLANTQTENIRTAVTMTFNQDAPPSEYFRTHITNFRKATSSQGIEGVVEQYMENIQGKYSSTYNLLNEPNVKPFVHKCLELCWLMGAQSPPVVFAKLTERENQERFDSAIYKPYTKTGAFIDYVVWPPIYLHKQGPLLAKGVAQARGVSSSRDIKTKKGQEAPAFPGTAVPVHTATNNDMARSFNVKSSKTNMTNFSRTVHGATSVYENDFSTPPEQNEPPYE